MLSITPTQTIIKLFMFCVFLVMSVDAHGLDDLGNDKAEVDITQEIVAYEIINAEEIIKSDPKLQRKILQIIRDTEEDRGKQIILAKDTIRFFAENTTDEHKKTSTRIQRILINVVESLNSGN